MKGLHLPPLKGSLADPGSQVSTQAPVDSPPKAGTGTGRERESLCLCVYINRDKKLGKQDVAVAAIEFRVCT